MSSFEVRWTKPNLAYNWMVKIELFPNSSNNFSPLRDLVQNQGRIMDNLSKKLASNDKMLKTISNKMESFFFCHQEST
jgi:hypothetical protein